MSTPDLGVAVLAGAAVAFVFWLLEKAKARRRLVAERAAQRTVRS